MSEFQHCLGLQMQFQIVIATGITCLRPVNFRFAIFLKRLMREIRKKSISLEYYQRPPFKGDPHECIIEDPQIFIGDPNLFTGDYRIFIGDPNIFVGDHNIFIWDPRFLLETPSYWSNRPQSFNWKLLNFEPQISWETLRFSVETLYFVNLKIWG